MTIYGVHAGLQSVAMADLRALWRKVEDLGFGWISVWDHFYDAGDGTANCHEAVATHAALACDTSKVTCGCLVYSVGYRHPAVLAKAITAIDHLSNGRAALGLGAGWHELEYRAYGIPFPAAKVRLDQLDEAAQCARSLLRNEVTSYEGQWFQLYEARLEPRPVQAALPIWIGGGGEKRTLRIVARHADGWNVPFVSPEQFARKLAVLRGHCEAIGRDPAQITTAVNLGLAWTDESRVAQFGPLAEFVRPGVLSGSDEQVIDRIGAYVEAGADQVNLALRAPFDGDAVERFAAALKLR